MCVDSGNYPFMTLLEQSHQTIRAEFKALAPKDFMAWPRSFSARKDGTWMRKGIEFRVPIFERVQPPICAEPVPFADFGRSCNEKRPDDFGKDSAKIITGVGVGTRILMTRWSSIEFDWVRSLKHAQRFGERDLQDDGIHFSIGLDSP